MYAAVLVRNGDLENIGKWPRVELESYADLSHNWKVCRPGGNVGTPYPMRGLEIVVYDLCFHVTIFTSFPLRTPDRPRLPFPLRVSNFPIIWQVSISSQSARSRNGGMMCGEAPTRNRRHI